MADIFWRAKKDHSFPNTSQYFIAEVWSKKTLNKQTQSYGQLCISYSPFSLSIPISFFFPLSLGETCGLLILEALLGRVCHWYLCYLKIIHKSSFTEEIQDEKLRTINSRTKIQFKCAGTWPQRIKAPPILSALRRDYNLGRVSITPIATYT